MFEIIEYCCKNEMNRVTCYKYIIEEVRQGRYVVNEYENGTWRNTYVLCAIDGIIGIGKRYVI